MSDNKYYNIKITNREETAYQLYCDLKAETRQDIFDKHWLAFEEAYRKAGWKATYDSPGWDENYDAFYKFEIKK